MLRVLHIGLGPLGQKVVRYVLEREGLKIVGAVDCSPEKYGKDLGELCSIEPMGIPVSKDLKTALSGKKADVAFLTTTSSLKDVEKQVNELADARINVVSTCEELSYPWHTHPVISHRLDKYCKKNRIACIGTGVNPGFLMDSLPCVLTAACQDVKEIKVFRVQDASKRRVPFQEKIGAGLSLPRFNERVEKKSIRHVGLPESCHMIAASVGWKLDKINEKIQPVLAKKKIKGGARVIEIGDAAGVEQICFGIIGKKKVIQLYFRAAVGEKESYDKIEVIGTPSFCSTIEGGLNGDIVTCAITVNACRSIMKAEPGLKTMLDIIPPHFFSRYVPGM
ncbi:dihydrodipicolinate reductase [Candidatus Riflebacteria bacterium]